MVGGLPLERTMEIKYWRYGNRFMTYICELCISIFREEDASAFAVWDLEMLVLWREENQRIRTKSCERGENQQETRSIYSTVPKSNPSHIGGRQELSPLREARKESITLTEESGYTV